MAVADYDEYVALEGAPPLRIPFFKTPLTTLAGRLYDSWATAALAGSAPTTAVACSQAVTGAIGFDQLANVSYGLRLFGGNLSSNSSGSFFLVDRLSHQGGLSGVTTGAQTTNLPTAALTRYTSGEDVQIALTIYTQIGTTAVTVTASYTNSAGTSGRTTQAVVIGGTAYREAGRVILLPLQSGDTGARAVASVTISATTGTAGAFGVTLVKVLAAYVLDRPGGQQRFNVLDGQGGLIRDIEAGPCLSWYYRSNTVSTTFSGNLHFSEAT